MRLLLLVMDILGPPVLLQCSQLLWLRERFSSAKEQLECIHHWLMPFLNWQLRQFTLQFSVLKREISKARIRIQLEPIAKGPAGFEYLKGLYAFQLIDSLNFWTVSKIWVSWISWKQLANRFTMTMEKFNQGTHGNMLLKSLRTGDLVFDRVSGAVHLAARGVVFCGSGLKGKELAETTLRQVGATVLIEKLIKAIEILILVATVSQNVHGPWYSQILV